MDLELLERRVSRLEDRLSHTEHDLGAVLRHTGIDPGRPAPAWRSPAPKPIPVTAPLVARPIPVTPLPDGRPVPASPPPPRTPLAAKVEDLPKAFAIPTPVAPRPAESRVTSGAGRVAKPSLEIKLGKTLAGWIGALTLVLGVGFFLKYAWQHEWINPSPVARVAFAALAGVALAAVGEYLLRRPMRGLAAVLYAAGVATTMTAFFAGSAYFSPPVLSQTPAALCVLATAGAGIGLALRADLPAVAILSLVGAYLSPLVLHTGAEQSLKLLSYLLLLSATGWTLCLLRPRWTGLRGFTFAASFVWYAVWFADAGSHHRDLAFAYLSITFAGTLAELYWSTQRAFEESPLAVVPLGTSLGRLESTAAVLSLLNTLLTSTALYLLHRNNQPLAGALALGLAAIQSLVAVSTFSRHVRFSAILQSTALVTLAVPLLLSRSTITLAWLVMAVALCVLARRLDLRWARPWAVTLWALSLVKVLTLDAMNPALRTMLPSLGTAPLTPWLLLAWATAVSGHALAFLAGDRALTRDRGGALLAGLATLVFLAATAATWSAGPTFTLASLCWLTAILGLRQQGGRIGYGAHGWAFLLLIAAKFLLSDGLAATAAEWSHPASSPLPFLNLTFLNALFLAGLFTWVRRLTAHVDGKRLSTLAVLAVLFATANFELCRLLNHLGRSWSIHDLTSAKQVALCALWSVVSLTLASLARDRTSAEFRAVRAVATCLFVAALARVMCFAADPALRAPLAHLATHPVSRWFLLMAAASLGAHALAWLTADRGTSAPDSSSTALAGLGTLTFMSALVGTWGFAPASTLAAIGYLCPILLLAPRAKHLNYIHHAWSLAVAVSVKWLLADNFVRAVLAYANPSAETLVPLFNLPTLCATLLGVAFYQLGRATPDGGAPTRHSPRALATVLLAALGFLTFNFELLRTVNHFAAHDPLRDLQIAKQVSLSILWSVTALATITVGFSRRLPGVRYAGLALLGVTLVKVLTVDMAGVETLWRILSFTATGALLMCVSFVYYKHVEARPST